MKTVLFVVIVGIYVDDMVVDQRSDVGAHLVVQVVPQIICYLDGLWHIGQQEGSVQRILKQNVSRGCPK